MKKIIILALAVLVSPLSLAAVQGKTDGNVLEISVSGTLSASDAAALETLLAGADKNSKRLLALDSDGGDADAALRLGRLLRATPFRAEVRSGARCLGVCVLVLAAATEKQIQGSVGVTRPTVDDKAGDAATRSAEQLNRARKYLGELDVPVDLAHLMFGMPAGKTRLLNEQELAFYRLVSAQGPQFNEDDNAGMAKKMGLALGQYLQFKELLLYKCDFFKDAPQDRQKCLDTAYRNFLPASR
jgi:hypothetical protein